MGIRQEILPYIDGNGLVSPNRTDGTGQGSDNGPMFTSEYFAILAKSGQLTPADQKSFVDKINPCIIDGLLNRAPYKTGQEGPDDYVGVLNASKLLGNTAIPRKLLWGAIRHLGFLNNVDGTKTASSFLVRQFQLVAAMVTASFPSWWNPLHIAIRLLAFPFYVWAAIVIFISCANAPTSDTDARRLSWHLVQTLKDKSFMCWIASKFWYKRLYKAFPNGMDGVAAIYYQAGHPFSKYWVD